MAAQSPLNTPALLSILEALATPETPPADFNEFYSLFLNDTLAAAVQPLSPDASVEEVTALMRGVRNLGKLTTVGACSVLSLMHCFFPSFSWQLFVRIPNAATPLLKVLLVALASLSLG